MSNTAKTGIAIVIIIIIVVIGWIWHSNLQPNLPAQPVTTANTQTTATTSDQQSATVPTSQGPSVEGTGLTASVEVSNTSLQADVIAVDALLNNLKTDTANIDSGLVGDTSIPVQR